MLGAGESKDAVAKLAGDESPIVRREVVLAGIEPAIIKGLDDADADVRFAAISISVSEATDRAIAQRIQKLDPLEQAVAARTLAARNASATAASIMPLLESEPLVVRTAAIHSLAMLKAITREQIEKQLTHPHPSVRSNAAMAIGSLQSADERFALATRALGDVDLGVRVPAATFLGELGRVDALDLLLKQLGAGYEPLRQRSRNALIEAAQTNNALVQPLATKAAAMLGDPDAERRIDASLILGVLRSHEGFEKHLTLLNDKDWRVVAQAAAAMGEIGDPAAGAALVGVYQRAVPAAMRDAPQASRPPAAIARAISDSGEQAILSCGKLGHKEILGLTKAIYGNKRESSQFRSAAIWALGVLGTPEQIIEGAQPLLNRLRDPEESGGVIMEAMRALGNGRVKSAAPQLKLIRDSRDVYVYSLVAARSLDYMNGTQTPFEPDVGTIVPETSIRAVTPAAK
jgi:HEAT repeat protein